MKMGQALLLVGFVVVTLISQTVPSAEQQWLCACAEKACGNNAIGGDRGDIFYPLSKKAVDVYFAANNQTGWMCSVPRQVDDRGEAVNNSDIAVQACFCQGDCELAEGAADLIIGVDRDWARWTSKAQSGVKEPVWLCGPYRGAFEG